MDITYKSNLDNFGVKQGLSAIFLVFLTGLLGYLNGYVLMQDFPIPVIRFLNTFWPIIDLLVIIPFLIFFKENLRSIGITSYNLKKTLVIGLLGAILLTLIYLALEKFVNGANNIAFNFSLQDVIPTLTIFVLGSVSEEIIYRGYIETRLHGLIKNTIITSVLTAFIFLFMHLPVFWAISGFSFQNLTLLHSVLILLLHFFCSFTYQKTGSLWGAILLHLVYNLATAYLIIS